MSANQACFPVSTMARVLGVSKAGYYAWRHRPPSRHALADAALLKRVRTVHASSRQTYGAPRVHADLQSLGERYGRKRIARLMREAGLVGASHRPGGPTTTVRDKDARPAPDLVDRNFTASGPDQLWVADITYVPTAAGFLYLAVVLDAWSRKIVGWSMANHLRTELVLCAMEAAVGQRRPKNVIHHSDQGSQGGLNRSSQRSDGGGCDGRAEAAIISMWTAAIAVTRSATSGHAERAATVLDADRDRNEQRDGCYQGRRVATCGNQMVPRGRRYATSDVQGRGEGAIGKISVFGGTRGDRAAARPGS